MAERKRRPTGPVYGNLAYDLDALVRERQLEEAGRMEQEERQRRRQPVQQPRRQTAAAPKVQVSPVLLGSIVVLTVMVMALLMGYVQLTKISTSVTALKNDIQQLDKEHVALLTQYEQTFEMTAVKEAAEAAGMSKPSAGQIEYVELGEPDQAVVYAAGSDGVLDKAFVSVKDAFRRLVEYFQ